MKNLVTAIVLILCLTSFLLVPIAGASDMCAAVEDFGYLDIQFVDQEETSWCWVASANAVTNRFGMIRSARSNDLYKKCHLYNIAKNPDIDCCENTSEPICQQSGWPWEVFQKLNPEINHEGEFYPMTWSQIKEQICPNWNPGYPFIFIARPHTGGLPHTHLVKGFGHSEQGFLQLLVDDHSGNGVQFIDYECKYKLPANCQVPSVRWDRVGDMYDLRPLLTSTDEQVPPSRPSEIRPRVQPVVP